MKHAINVTKKIVVGFIINLFAIISAVLNVWEFIKMFAVRIITKIPETFLSVLSIFSILFTIYCIFSPDFDSVGNRIFIIVMFVFLVGLLFSLSELITNLICALLIFIVSIFNTSWMIAFMGNAIFSLVDRYLNYCDDNMTAFDRIYVFGICYILNFFRNTFKTIQKVLSIVIYPLFAVGLGFLGYWLCFIDSLAPIMFSFNWWFCLTIIVLFIGAALYLAYCFNKTIDESAEDTDFGLFDIFEIYSETFKNFTNTKSQKNEQYTSTEEPKEENEYYIMFSKMTSFEEIKRAYRKLAKEVHPDVSELPPEVSCKKMSDLNDAYKYFQNRFC